MSASVTSRRLGSESTAAVIRYVVPTRVGISRLEAPMSSMGDRYQQNLEKAVVPLIDGPLVSATIGSPVGSMAHLFKAEALNLGLAGMGDDLFRASGASRGGLVVPK